MDKCPQKIDFQAVVIEDVIFIGTIEGKSCRVQKISFLYAQRTS